eukprot:TRINITY_DN5377_c0_g1_i4.p1 TRINITY_DN5377_c0_g1~~TRINITY_DN5377_c0_g1_i4.p1  ORF type:complete len:105 (+),score=14.93 TRINITY_DN5377_c0_g1_i4:24-338(+)
MVTIPGWTILLLLAVTGSALVLIETEQENYCGVDDVTRLNTQQNCSSDNDCLLGDECQRGGSAFAFCFNNTRFYKIGCPCQDHEDCPEACYSGRKVPTCGPWLF